jgi:hypothetical protein
MTTQEQAVKMMPVDAKLIEAAGYADRTRCLYIKCYNSPTLCFTDVPQFRYRGLMAAPRMDACYTTYIKSSYLAKEAEPRPPA